MADPIDEFLELKKTAFLGAGALGSFGKNIGRNVAIGGAMAAGGAGVAGLGAAAGKIFNAITKKRDFDKMLEANPHLRPALERDPDGFNGMFTSLRSMSPEFTRDPMVAGAFMNDAMESPAESRGYVALRAHRERTPQKPGPLGDAALSSFQKGVGMKPNDASGFFQ